MSSISIKSALTAIILGLTLMLGGVGFLSLNKLSEVNDHVVSLGSNWLPSVDETHLIATDVAELRMTQAAHILSESDAEMKAIEVDVAHAIKSLSENLATYDKLVSSDEERAVYRKIEAAIEAYKTQHDKLLGLSRQNKNDEAAILFKGDMKKSFDDLVAQVHQAVEINKRGSDAEVKTSAAAYASASTLLMSIVGLALAVAVGAILFTLKRIIQPIDAITSAMGVLAGGNMAVDIPGVGRGDEIGRMAGSVEVFKTNMIETERLRAEQVEFEKRAAAQRKADMNKLAADFQRAVGGIVETVSAAASQLESSAGSLTKTAERTQARSGSVAAASEETSANVQSVAAASEELTATISEISRQVQQSSSVANQAVTQAAKTNEKVSELSESANRIGDVIGLINTIAGQTNLLALNATIEAARAGEAGRGFAIVAQEVKALAEQTAKATNEIAAQISGMQAVTNDAVIAIQDITQTIGAMSEISGIIAAAVEQQGATTQEISRNVQEAARGTTEVASSITDVSKGASDTGTASAQVLTSAKQLSSESNNLRRQVETFLASVRAA
ncbi:MAG: methyl-accepting chemotaxis protein [Hyphomicrobium sp.]